MKGEHAQSKCAIICDARTGSNLLGYSLGYHPEIEYGDEILSSAVPCITRDCKDYAKSLGCNMNAMSQLPKPYRDTISNKEYIDFVCSRYNLFKILYYHLYGYDELIYYLIHSNLKIIHLKRKSLVAKHISYMVALRDEFLYIKKEPRKKKPIHIDIGNFLEHMNDMIQTEKEWDDRLSGRKDVLTLEYSNMITNWDDTMNKCQDFLGVHNKKLRHRTIQAINVDHIDLVTNKEELLKAIIDNDFEQYI